MPNLLTRARAKALELLLPRPYPAKFGSYSFVAESDTTAPNDRLLDLAAEAIDGARRVTFDALAARVGPEATSVLRRWPGEHYRLLAALCAAAKPKTVLEIGTASGLSSLAILSALPAGSRLVTFDILPWDYQGAEAWGGETVLKTEDFTGGRLVQEIGDLSHPSTFDRHRDLLAETDLFFVDGPKDGVFEQVFLDRLAAVSFTKPPILMFDDVRLWKMIRIWKDVTRPKLDLTSFGHWSGSGLIDWV